MVFFTAIGVAVSALIGIACTWLLWQICGNVYGGIKGAYRYTRLSRKKVGHWKLIKVGFQNWLGGGRYNGKIGSYWKLGGLEVPIDGRDPVIRDKFRGG